MDTCIHSHMMRQHQQTANPQDKKKAIDLKIQAARRRMKKREGDSLDLWMPNEIGYENLTYITNDDIDNALANVRLGILCLIKPIYFHPAHRENHSVRMHKNNRSIELVVNGRWAVLTRSVIETYMFERVLGKLLIDRGKVSEEHVKPIIALTPSRYELLFQIVEVESLDFHPL